jgi:hypothetical protein
LDPYTAPRSDSNQVEQPPSKRTGWKIYAIGVVALQAAGLLISLPKLDPAQAVDYGMTIVGVVGLFGFAYRRPLLRRWIWMLWSILLPVWDVVMGAWIYPSQESRSVPVVVMTYFMLMLLFVPEYVALIRYAYFSSELWPKADSRVS